MGAGACLEWFWGENSPLRYISTCCARWDNISYKNMYRSCCGCVSSFVVVSIIIAYYSKQHKAHRSLYTYGYATGTGLCWTIQKHTTTYIGRPLVPSWVRLECPEEPKLDPQNKKIKLRRFALPPMNDNARAVLG